MRNKATKKNMDLDLRRYGKMLYSKAEESGGSDGGGSGEIDYEAIYQFQIKKIKDIVPALELSNAIIPEHYSDVTDWVGTKYSEGTIGVFKTNNNYIGNISKTVLKNIVKSVLFVDWTIGDIIFFGEYTYSENPDSGGVY